MVSMCSHACSLSVARVSSFDMHAGPHCCLYYSAIYKDGGKIISKSYVSVSTSMPRWISSLMGFAMLQAPVPLRPHPNQLG
jgi:hypothetical protein